MSHKNKIFKLCFFLSVVVLILGIGLNSRKDMDIAVASETYEQWVIAGGTNELNDSKVKEETIERHTTHRDGSSSSLTYGTSGYYITREPDGSDKAIIHVKVNTATRADGVATGSYTVIRDDFMDAANELGISSEDIVNNGGTYTVYLSSIFDIYLNNEVKLSGLMTLDEVMDAPRRLGYGGWSLTTQNNLPYYYNIPYTLTTAATYPVDVVAVDSDNNVLQTLLTDTSMYKDSFSPSVSTENITVNGITYKYENTWSYSYVGRKDGREYDMGGSGQSISIGSMPDASSLTIYLKYKPTNPPKPYNVEVEAVDTSGKHIATLSSSQQVYPGDTYTFTLSDKDKVLHDKYYYTNGWEFTFTTLQDEEQTIYGSGSSISQRMPFAKEGITAVFQLIYSTDPNVPTVTPTPGVTPTPVPEPPVPVEPKPEVIQKSSNNITAKGKIEADLRSQQRFNARLGIPTTESLYGEVIATEYILGYRFSKKVGTIYYPIEVRKTYNLQWYSATPDSAGGAKLQEESVEVKKIIMVPRVYGYWAIDYLDYYKIQSATLNNYALPDGKVTLYPNSSYYSIPSISYSHNGNRDSHLIAPKEVESGITLASETITGGTEKPRIPNEDAFFKYEAYVRTGNLMVKSDRVVFNGVTVMDDGLYDTEAPSLNIGAINRSPSMTNSSALYKSGQVIEATKENGEYASNGTIQYECLTTSVSTMGAGPLKFGISGLDNVIIHTPVVCKPIVKADNDKYVQLVNPDLDAIQLVIDSESSLNDFTVKISNTGDHTSRLGYFTRDFSRSLIDPENVSYIASKGGLLRNEVKFPFDVYVDVGSDGDISNDDYIKAGTWIVLGRNTARFYLPMWVEEGIYEAEFRTIAVNAVGKIKGSSIVDKIQMTEREKNTQRANYVATNTVKFQVSGRIYGLTIYDLTDYPIWEEAFRVPNSNNFKKYERAKYPDGTNKSTYNKGYSYDYTLGTNDQYGNDTGRNIKYTFPLVNGSHPLYKNMGILKTGYMIRFSLETTGYMYTGADIISIEPSFYFVDRNGQNRQAVDLYYNEEFNKEYQRLVKVGSARDKINMKSMTMGDLNHGIPKVEIEQTAKVLDKRFQEVFWRRDSMFTFSQIRLSDVFRTFIGSDYASKIKSLPSYTDVVANGITDENIIKRTQRWYGAYYLPNYVYAAPKGYDVIGYSQKHGIDYHEDFWLKDGYIIINLKIETVDRDGVTRLSYINPINYKDNGHCSMWVMEGPPLEKTNEDGAKFKFYAGDFFIYDIGKRASDDYSAGAIY